MERQTLTKRKTLQEMATSESRAASISGHPADTCPYCGAGMFIDGVNRTQQDIIRYVECRACHRRFMSRQAPAKIVREIDGNSAGGMPDIRGVSKRY